MFGHPMRSILLRFFNELRTAGLSISVSESIDALQAAAAVGVERDLLREALATSLVKAEEDRPLFEHTFAQFFASSHPSRKGKQRDSAGGGQGQQPQPGGTAPARLEHRLVPSSDEQSIQDTSFNQLWKDGERQPQPGDSTTRQGNGFRGSHQEQETGSTARLAQQKALLEKPFQTFDGHDVEASTALLEELSRRLRAHLSRRYIRQKHGRLDFRRTIRASLSQGGVPIHLKLRGRQPGKPDLLALCDLSGSVAVVSDFLLALLAPATAYFRQVRTFAYVDRLCEVSFEQGHVVPHDGIDKMLDLYARSDFGKVLQHFWQTQGEQLLTRNTIVLVLGDARNNRLPPRPDLLARIGERAKTLLWLNPEPQQRWDTGDSVMSKYAPVCDAVFACGNLQELIQALQRTL
jgi:uncharacterized protein with von Willebrand factor type A (vWA) domain